MSGVTIRAVPRRVVDFGGLITNLTEDLVLADRVDVRHWLELTMLVQVHVHSLLNGAGTITIGAFNQSLSSEDPDVTFVGATAVGSLTLDSFTGSPAYAAVPLSPIADVGDMVRLVASATRTQSGTLNATISVNISAKNG